MEGQEIKTIEDNDIIETKDDNFVSTDIVIVSELLEKNNELVEHHNNILIENKKIININMIVNTCSKFILLPIAIFILFKISLALEINNEKEIQIINKIPKLDIPSFNIETPTPSVNVTTPTPTPNVHINNQTVFEKKKIAFHQNFEKVKDSYKYVFYHKNASNSIVYCKSKKNNKEYDIVFAPHEKIPFLSELSICMDTEIIEIKNEKDFEKIK